MKSDAISKLFQRACAALYICPTCGSTTFGKDIRMARTTLALVADKGLPTFTCLRCNADILEPIEEETV